MRQTKKGEDIFLFGEGEERRDHVWIQDVADLTCRVLCHQSVGVLNIATGSVVSFCESANPRCLTFGFPPQTCISRISDSTIQL